MRTIRRTTEGPRPGGAVIAALALMAGLLLLAFPHTLAAQDETGGVRGQVIDQATGEAVPYVQILIEGTTRGTVTSRDGRFQIGELRPGAYTVQVRSIGYKTARSEVQVTPATYTDVDFSLQVTAVPLDEVVATGQSAPVARRAIATSVATIEARDLETTPVNSLSEMLQARVPGVTVMPSGGMPGQGSRIILRGLGSLQRSTQPVIYVDGIRIDNSADTFMGQSSFGGQAWTGLDDINPEDIERIEIVRGASAANLYGTEASAGVVQIFTKQGQEGIQSFYLRSEAGMADTPRGWWDVDGRSLLVDDFFNQYVSTGFQHRQHVSVRGAVDRFNYYASGTHRDMGGVLPNTGMQHSAFRANMNVSPWQEFIFGVSTAYSRRTMDFPYDGDHSFGFVRNALGGEGGVTLHPDTSLMLDVALASSRYTAGARMEWTPRANWRHQLVLGLDFFTSDNTDHRPFGTPTAPDNQGSKANARRIANTYNLDYQTSFSLQLTPGLGSRTSFGIQGYQQEINWNWAYGEGWPAPGLFTINVAANDTGNEDRVYTEQLGFFLEEQLNLGDYLYVTLAGRLDGHSAAGENERWQLYPKLGMSWLPGEQGLLPEGLSTLRLRAAYGEAGQAPQAFSALRTLIPVAVVPNIAGGIVPGNIGDPNLAPERSREIEIGADVALLGNRLALDATYYNQRTDNAIYPVFSIPSEGFIQPQVRNVGGLRAQGFELAAEAVVVRSRALNWSVWTNLALHESEVLDFTDETAIAENIYGTQWIRPGAPVAAFFDDADELIGPAYPTRTIHLGTRARLPGGLNVRAVADHQGGHYIESNTLRELDMAALPPGEVFETPRSEYVFSADFWRVREVVVGYQVPERFYRMLPVQTMELNVAGRNLWRSQTYPGIEVQGSYDPLQQRANQSYFGAPLPRQFVVGLTARFGAVTQ
jgi:TonB-dependent starch-binding outer membrane protein SusC